ncbi:MAG: hypothetical protein ACUVV5_07435 [Candidatus Aminicenantales bacterium]
MNRDRTRRVVLSAISGCHTFSVGFVAGFPDPIDGQMSSALPFRMNLEKRLKKRKKGASYLKRRGF